MMKELEGFYESKVDIPLIRHGWRQRIETLINEEAPSASKIFTRREKDMDSKVRVFLYHKQGARQSNPRRSCSSSTFQLLAQG